MLKNVLFAFAAVLFFQKTTAQTLLPFLAKNGKYGFADEAGKIVIAPEFEGRVEPFSEKTLSIDCKKNGESVRLFRSGLSIPNPHLELHIPRLVVDFDSHDRSLDTIAHLVAIQKNQQFLLVDIRNGKTVETIGEGYLKRPNWAKIDHFGGDHYAPFRFRHGVARIFKTDTSVNFVDENLREILPKDVAVAIVVDEKYFIFAEGESRFGVADRSGKTVGAPVFHSLEPSGITGFFIANKLRDGSNRGKWSCGLVRSDGKIVIDTVFTQIGRVPNSDLFIVQKDNKSGLLDVNGRAVVPIEAAYIHGNAFGFSVARWANGGGMNLFDRNGKRLFEKNVAEVAWIPIGKKLFFKVKTGGWTSILDTSMTVVARDSVENLDLIAADPFQFLVRRTDSKNRLVSIRDGAGKTLIDGIDAVWVIPGWPDGLRMIYLNNLKGIADRNFKALLPPIFEEIMLEETRRDTFIWAKKKGDPLFSAFDKRGKRRTDIDDAPDARRESAFGVIAKMQAIPGGGQMATMFDGTQIKWPDSLKNQHVLSSFRTKTGGAVVVGFDSKRITTVLDDRLRNLLPAGFTVPENSASETVLERFQQFGLLVVKKMPVETPVPKPAPRPKPKPTEPIEQVVKAPDVKISDAPVQEYPIRSDAGFGTGSGPSKKVDPMLGTACGVIDLDGNWVVEPKMGVEFLPLSQFMVAEFPAGARSSSHQFFENGLRLHRVQQAKKGVFFEANWLGRDRFDPEEGNTMKIGRLRAGTTRMAEYAYFNQKGEPITDWIFENGPDFLRTKNLVHIWEKDVFRARQTVIDANGKTLFELGDLMTDDPPHIRASNWELTYLIVQKRRNEVIKDALGRLIPLPKGLMDSTGRLVLPLEYFDLGIWEKDRFLTAKTAAGKLVLMTFEGKKIHEFEPAKSGLSIQSIGRDNDGERLGTMAVWTEKETILVGEKNELLRRFDLPFSGDILPEKLAERYVVLLKNNQKVWADFRSGRVFCE